ncbi:MAG: succinate dehydrogenase assembly factor 2 [Bacterioplanes sp.]|nr:succinate dehydrogenase assembly factor 2 [Bacterioplanes sp.]
MVFLVGHFKSEAFVSENVVENQANEIALKRLIWHSRRGMLELDCLLLPFAEEALPSLSAQDQALYERFLSHEDPDLFAWLMEHQPADDGELERMVALVLGHARNRKP